MSLFVQKTVLLFFIDLKLSKQVEERTQTIIDQYVTYKTWYQFQGITINPN